ncbi:hypothetical protein T492DRAFT_434700 [Pavlovales sp. CCMP2436]|nr:hypothetical protein T492DRAFT_434700 [Pavlovales sp. CCMP2436]
MRAGLAACLVCSVGASFVAASPGDDSDGRFRTCTSRYAEQLIVVGTASKNSAIVMRGRALVAGLEARIRATTPDPSRDIVLGAGFGSAGTRSLGLALGYAGLIVFHASNVLKPPRPQFLKRDSLSTHWRSAVAAIEGNRTATNQIAAELVDGGNADFVATCHASCDKVDYPGLFKQYPADAVVDMPSAEYFLDLWRAFPSAQVVLITRPADSHVDSRRAIYRARDY